MNEKDIEHRLTEVESRSKSNSHRLEDLEKRQDDLDELVGVVKVLAVREEVVEKEVKEVKTDVKSLLGKSGKKWDDLVDRIIWAVAAAIVGFLLAHFGF